jgi:hypothetical protein
MVQSSIWCCVIAHGCICTVGGLYRVGQLIPKTCWRFMTSHKLMPSCERRRMSGRACNFPRPFNRVWATFRSWRRSAGWLATPTPRYNLHAQERHRIPRSWSSSLHSSRSLQSNPAPRAPTQRFGLRCPTPLASRINKPTHHTLGSSALLNRPKLPAGANFLRGKP